MAFNLPPVPNNPLSDTFVWRDWFFKIQQILATGSTLAWNSINFLGSNLRDIQTRQHNALQDMQGGNGTDEEYHLNLTQYNLVNAQPYIEVAETTFTLALTTTPQLIKPTTTVQSSNINYDSATGEFTFLYPGVYQLTVAVNAVATIANQYVYIYQETNSGSGWSINVNSGKQAALLNGDITQVTFSLPVKRTAGQKVRYYIYSNDTSVTVQTTTLPSSTAKVPAIRIHFAGVN